MVAALVAAVVLARPWEEAVPAMGPTSLPEDLRSVSVDFGIVIDPETDWAAVDERLDSVGANMVELGAGRVEFTAFDWDAHPEAAAEPGTDHLATAARALSRTADGSRRAFGLIVDAYVPRWIQEDPSIAGRDVDGQPTVYQSSATALSSGPVADRLVEYVVALGERYGPAQISVTELFLDRFSYGDDDLELFRQMTGATDWPRDADGAIIEESPELGSWRSQILADLLGRMRAGLDEVRGGDGEQIALSMDVRVDWEDLARGDTSSGHDYAVLLSETDRLTIWGYTTLDGRAVGELQDLTAALAVAGFDMSRITVSVGLWAGGVETITPETMAEAVALAATNGVRAVNVTPYSLMTDEYWTALASVWGPDAREEPT